MSSPPIIGHPESKLNEESVDILFILNKDGVNSLDIHTSSSNSKIISLSDISGSSGGAGLSIVSYDSMIFLTMQLFTMISLNSF